jgi:hypothetical protein
MRSGFPQRAAVAIVLMGALLAPFGVCLQRTQHTAHSCCAHASQTGRIAKPDCCTLREQSPTVPVAPASAGSAPMILVRAFFSTSELSSPREVLAAFIIPQHSPPGRASILRI